MIPKILTWLLATVLLTTLSPAKAQQPTKVPRIGYFSGGTDPSAPGLSFESFSRLFEISVISRGKTFSSRSAMLKETGTASQAWWRNWFNSKSMCF